jgi:hypothetical protein
MKLVRIPDNPDDKVRLHPHFDFRRNHAGPVPAVARDVRFMGWLANSRPILPRDRQAIDEDFICLPWKGDG